MDALSDLLSNLRVEGSFSSRLDARGSWALRFPGDSQQLKFSTVLAGEMEIVVTNERPLTVRAGDLFLLANGSDFVARSIPSPEQVQDGLLAYRRHRGEDGVVRIGSAGPPVQLLSGRFTFDRRSASFALRHLPPVIHLRADDPSSRPLAIVLELLRLETTQRRPGADLAGGHLAGLLLVQALRIFLDTHPQPPGWLGGLQEPKIARAMNALHGDVKRAWTVQELAKVALMSRTAFAARFREVVGQGPISYLTEWRMTLAKHLLERSESTVGVISALVGYESETAFNAAFKRKEGIPPARYRARLRGEA